MPVTSVPTTVTIGPFADGSTVNVALEHETNRNSTSNNFMVIFIVEIFT